MMKLFLETLTVVQLLWLMLLYNMLMLENLLRLVMMKLFLKTLTVVQLLRLLLLYNMLMLES